jgi:predicted nucleic acid-binding protein/GNAT superfamily N-acetyltransferase
MRTEEIDLHSPYLKKVKYLGRLNSTTLGFLPEGAFDEHARRKQIIVALDEAEECIGYVLYRISHHRAAIVHLCVEESHRRNGIARELVNHLQRVTEDLDGISLKCRRDYEASKLWPALHFVARGEQPGRGKDRAPLMVWHFDFGNQTLFSQTEQEKIESALCVSIDLNVFLDLTDPSRQGHEESGSLLADWLSDLELYITDETFNEIARIDDVSLRRRQMEFARRFPSLSCQHQKLTDVEVELEQIFPRKKSIRDESDFRQLARTIAAAAKFFVTRDNSLLGISDKVYESFGVTVIRPSDLIIRLDEIRRENEYQPVRLAGTLSEVRLVQSETETLLTQIFQEDSQKKTKQDFQTLLRRLFANPKQYSCYIAREKDGNPIGLWAYNNHSDSELNIPLLRVARSPIAETLARHIILRTIAHSAYNNKIFTKITDKAPGRVVIDALREDGFREINGEWLKVNLSIATTAQEIAGILSSLSFAKVGEGSFIAELAKTLHDDSKLHNPRVMSEIERLLWPAKITDAAIPTFIIPIRPEWAKELFDEELANQTLFGATPELALNRESVYYRSSQNSGGLRAPGRILWYVSSGVKYSGTGQIRACSRLDEVVVADPKSLYRRFKRLGVYRWERVYEVAKKDVSNRIMALRFSDTELFKAPISRKQALSILKNDGIKTQFQSPIYVPAQVFERLYTIGSKYQQKED